MPPETPERVPSFYDAERYVKLVLTNIGDLEDDLKKLDADINLQIYFIEKLLRRLLPSAGVLLGLSTLGPIAPIVWHLGVVRSLTEKLERGLRAQKAMVGFQREAIILLDDRRSSALRATGMIQSSKESPRDLRPMSPASTEETSPLYGGKPMEDSESKLVDRIEWIVCELQSRNRKFVVAERDLSEGEEFTESAKRKTDKEVLLLARGRIQQVRRNKATRDDKWRRECVIL